MNFDLFSTCKESAMRMGENATAKTTAAKNKK